LESKGGGEKQIADEDLKYEEVDFGPTRSEFKAYCGCKDKGVD